MFQSVLEKIQVRNTVSQSESEQRHKKGEKEQRNNQTDIETLHNLKS